MITEVLTPPAQSSQPAIGLAPMPGSASDLFGPWCDTLDRMDHDQLAQVLRFTFQKLCERTPEKALMRDEPWPLCDVLAKLIEAAEILMHQKNYDGDQWEQISHAIDRGKAALSNWQNTEVSHGA